MKSRKDRRASGGKIFSPRLPDGGTYRSDVLIVSFSPFRFAVFLAPPGLAAGVVGAYLRRAVLGEGRAVHRVAARGHSLRLERLRVEIRGHLRGDDAREIVLHVHLLDRAVLHQHGDAPRRGGRRGRRRRRRGGEGRLVHRDRRRRICLSAPAGGRARVPLAQIGEKGKPHRDEKSDISVEDRSFHACLPACPSQPRPGTGVCLDGMGKRG